MNGIGNGRTVCSFCGEDISAHAKRCPYCGSVLGTDNRLNTDEVKADNFNDDSLQIQDTDSDFSQQGLFDDSINSNNNTNDFIRKEKSYEEKNGLFDTKPDDKAEQKIENPVNPDNFMMSNTPVRQESIPVQKPDRGDDDRHRSYPMGSVPKASTNLKPSISNAMKVFITTICNFIPGIGQLAGVIIAIVFMNSEDDSDKRSFGLALLINSLIVFVFMCISCCILGILFSEI